jgi:hypothetical protein
MKKDIKHFYRNYKLIGKAEKNAGNRPPIFLCRFCGKSAPGVTFHNDAHLLPELIGKNDFVSFEECDTCNNLFSKYESHLAIYLRPYLAMLGVKGKRKIPTFQSRSVTDKPDSRTIIRTLSANRKEIELGALDDYIVDHDKKILTIRFRNPPYIPLNVYKAFVKIGLSLLPNEKLKKYSNLFHWIADRPYGRLDYFPVVVKVMMTESQFPEPRAELSETGRAIKKNGFLPNLTLHLCFGNLIFQIFLPLSKCFDHRRVKIKQPIYIFSHHIFLGLGNTESSRTIKMVGLGEKEAVQRDQEINFSFNDGEFNIGK